MKKHKLKVVSDGWRSYVEDFVFHFEHVGCGGTLVCTEDINIPASCEKCGEQFTYEDQAAAIPPPPKKG